MMRDNRSGTARSVNSARSLTHSLDYTEEGIAMKATRVCKIDDCDRPVSARGWCSSHYNRWRRYSDPLASPIVSRSPDGLCIIDGCDRPVNARGWCSMHYHRWRRYGDPLVFPLASPSSDGLCIIEDCEKPCRTRGLCRMHYARWERTGTTDPGKCAQLSAVERFEKYVDRTDGCWEWSGYRGPHGYGWLAFGGGAQYAHRWSWEYHNGRPIPDGLLIRHTCDNPPCVNPDHLLLGTHVDNARDMVERGRGWWMK